MICDFFFSSRRRHTRLQGDWSSDVCSSDLLRTGRPTSSITVRASLGPASSSTSGLSIPLGERNLAGTRPDLAGVTPVPALRLGSQRSRADRPGLAPRGSRRAGGRVRAPEMRLRFDSRPRYRPHLHHGVDPARGGLGFVRARVLGPLVLFQAGVRPNGVRRVEQSVPARVPPLRSTLALHDRESCRNALVATVALYTDLREQLASPTLVRRTDAERAARSFLT